MTTRDSTDRNLSAARDIPTRARVVIVGGGVIGTSAAYHLAKLGWTDVVLLERDRLTSGTTWHAAGLIVSGGMTTETLAWMFKYSRDLYETLEDETGHSTGFRPVGYLQTAGNQERLDKLRRESDFLGVMGIEREEISGAEVAQMWPHADTSGVIAGFHSADEGRADPYNVAMALASGARSAGVRIIEQCPVTGIIQQGGRVTGVVTDHGVTEAEYVLNCAGMWAREVGAMAGVAVPLQAIEHAYLITEPIDGVSPDLPILEIPDRFAYYREETGGLMVGLFEPVAAPWSVEKIPEEFSFGEIPSDWDRLAPFLAHAMEILPGLEDVGVRKLFTGPESFTPDNGFLMGEAPELDNFFVAAGFNSLGILTGGGAGSIIANWIVDGVAPIDVTDVDIARMSRFQMNRAYLADRSVELLGRLFATGSWPHSSPTTARNVRRSVIHQRLGEAGAHFSESSGWENAAWFAPHDAHPEPRLTYGRPDWFEHHAMEHRAVRDSVALFDMSSMSKFLVEGPDAESMLNLMSGNDVGVAVGRCVYTQWMNERGGIDADVTVTRLADDCFLVVAAELFHRRVESMLRRSALPAGRVHIGDVTSAFTLLSVQGPESRNLLAQITRADLGNDAFPYLTAQEIDLHHAFGWALRMSFVGELGWELYVPTEFAMGVYERIVEVGARLGLSHAGMETLESTRTEAGRLDYGLDIENSDSPLEAGLAFAIDFDKPGGFVGRHALLTQRDARPYRSRLVQFLLEDPEPLLHGEEPILFDGSPVGYLRSGHYGHTLGGAMGFGYVEHHDGVTAELVAEGPFEIQVAGVRHPARASLRSMYDPENLRVRA
jgi:glycine cleavage system aminomethyltransferase T/glycine/D-amino acid oxidase-like deaminating enzyme